MPEINYRSTNFAIPTKFLGTQTGPVYIQDGKLFRSGRRFRFVGWNWVRNFYPEDDFINTYLPDKFQDSGVFRIHGIDSGWESYFPRGTNSGDTITWNAGPTSGFIDFLQKHTDAGHLGIIDVLMDINSGNALPNTTLPTSGDIAVWGDRRVIGHLLFTNGTTAWVDSLWGKINPFKGKLIWAISNEDTSVSTGAGTIRLEGLQDSSASIQASAQASWNTFLLNEYGTDDAVKTAFRESEHSSSEQYTVGTNAILSSAGASPLETSWASGSLGSTGTVTWTSSSLQLGYTSGGTGIRAYTASGINIIRGMKYKLQIDLRKPVGLSSTVLLAMWDNLGMTGGDNASPYVSIVLTTALWTTRTYYFVATKDTTGGLNDITGRVEITNQTAGSTVQLRNFSLTQVGTKSYPVGTESVSGGTVALPDIDSDYYPKVAAAWKWWLNDVEKGFFDTIRSFIRTKDPSGLCISTQAIGGFGNLIVSSDIADHHFYGPNHINEADTTSTYLDNLPYSNYSSFFQKLYGLVDGKPNVMTECGWTSSNRYYGAFPILYAIWASVQDLDGFVIHAYGVPNSAFTTANSGGVSGNWERTRIPDNLNYDGNPIVNQLVQVAANVLRNNNIPAATSTKVLTIAASDIYNHYSYGWRKFPLGNSTTPQIAKADQEQFWNNAIYLYIVNKMASSADPYSDNLNYKWRMRLGDSTSLTTSGSADTRCTVSSGVYFSWADDKFCFLQVDSVPSTGYNHTWETPTQGDITVFIEPVSGNGPANIVVNAMDGLDLSVSQNIAIVAFSETYNTGQTWSTSGTTRRVSSAGSAPGLVVNVGYTITWPNSWRR